MTPLIRDDLVAVIVCQPERTVDVHRGDRHVVGWGPLSGPLRLGCESSIEKTQQCCEPSINDIANLAAVSNESDLPIDPSIDPDELAEVEQAMAEARERLINVPAETVVANHVMGLFELGAIHLSSSPPNVGAAQLAIDSMALLVDGLGDRLGPDAPTMRDALANIRMAFVAATGQSDSGQSDSGQSDS